MYVVTEKIFKKTLKKNITKKRANTNESFWKFVKYFLQTKVLLEAVIALVKKSIFTFGENTLASTVNNH